jgi:DNA-binding MarR family transcriptional regulator
LKDIISLIFGNAVFEKDFRFPTGTPNYIRYGYSVKKLVFGEKQCLLVRPKESDWNLATVKKQIKTIGQITGQSIIVDLDRLTASQRTNLIESGVAFISGTGQVFIPFWGSYFEEKIINAQQPAETMSANAQLVFLFLFYNRKEIAGITQTQIAHALNMPKVTCTRAVQLLSGLGLIQTVDAGTAKRVFLNEQIPNILQKAISFMNSPVHKLLYVSSLPGNIRFKISGIRAVTEQSMLQALPSDGAFAIDREAAKGIDRSILLDEQFFRDFGGQIIEVWKYDPFLLSDTEYADDISLLLDLADESDERVQYQLDGIRGKYNLEGIE